MGMHVVHEGDKLVMANPPWFDVEELQAKCPLKEDIFSTWDVCH